MATTNVQITPTRSTLAQRIIALGVVFAFFYWASSIVMTLMLAVLLAYFLDPAVVLLERLHIPRALGALAVLLLAVAAVGAIGYLLVNRTQSFAYAWPRYSAVLRRAAGSVDRKIATTGVFDYRPGAGSDAAQRKRKRNAGSPKLAAAWNWHDHLGPSALGISPIPGLLYARGEA